LNIWLVKKIVNGTKKFNELIPIFKFKLNETATNVHEKLMQWLFSYFLITSN